MNINWDFKDFYSSSEELEKDIDDFEKFVKELDINKYKGKLGNYEIFSDFIKLNEEIDKKLDKVYFVAYLKTNQHYRDTESHGFLNRIQHLYYITSQLFSFSDPEILSLGRDLVFSFLEKDPLLSSYYHEFEILFDNSASVKSEQEEFILSNYSNGEENIQSIFTALSGIDYVASKVKLSNGETVKVTASNFPVLISNSVDERERNKIFKVYNSRLEKNKNTYAAIYSALINNISSEAVSRGYNSILESVLKPHHIPVELYKTLVNVTRDNTEPFKRYLALRKDILKLKQYHTYDRFLSIANDSRKYSYEEAREIYFKSLEKYPTYFQKKERASLDEGYVDVLPDEDKRTGAFSNSIYEYHPFILLNHDFSLDSIFTIAHEAGHSAHSLFSNEAQPRKASHYRIFVAEIASTFNEHNLFDYMYDNSQSHIERIKLLEHSLNGLMGTYYRQVVFADFELIASEKVDQGIALTSQVLCDIMADLYKKYYGFSFGKNKPTSKDKEYPGIYLNETNKDLVWAGIPHFFNVPYYIYQYATSFAASLKFYTDVKNEVPGSFDNYINLLKAGNTDYPVNLVKKAGVDLTTKEPYLAVIDRFNYLLSLLEKELKVESID